MSPLRVTYVHQDGLITGSAISLKNLLIGFKEDQVKATVLLAKEEPACDLFREIGIDVKIVPYQAFWTFPGPKWYQRSNFRMFSALLPNRQLRNAILDTRPDIVHVNDKAALAAGLSLRHTSVPVVQHLRSNYRRTYSILNRVISKMVIRSYADLLIAISEDESDGFENHPNLHVVYNSISQDVSQNALKECSKVRAEFTIQDEEIVISYVGLLNELKGAWLFLESCGHIKKMFPSKKFRFFMIAPIPDKNILLRENGQRIHPLDKAKEICRRLNILNDVVFTGYRKDVLSILAQSYMLMIMNKQGVLGRQPFEAMSVGTPVISVAGFSGKSRIIENNINGVLVHTYDVADLSAAAASLINDLNYRNMLGKNGLKTAKEFFNPIINSQKVYGLYRSLLNHN